MQKGTPTDAQVAILLATYNGERYLDELMRSLLAQTHCDFVVIARDDCSNDQTPTILSRWSTAYPDKVFLLSDKRGRLGSLRSFSLLMEECASPYFALCDQDDVWLPEKVALCFREMRALEETCGKAMPILVHSDLTVVDQNLREISASFFKRIRVNPTRAGQLDQLIINNMVAGCSSMGNQALLELACPIPDEVPYHDWWLALLAASCGVLRTMAQPTLLYRQHGGNQIGAQIQVRLDVLRKLRLAIRSPRVLTAKITRGMLRSQSQASVLLSIAGDNMLSRHREFLQIFCLLHRRHETAHLPWGQRAWLFIRFLAIRTRALPLVMRFCF